MDLWAAIRELYKERERLSKVIATLEQLQESAGAGKAPKRRGRRAMGAAERREVSERMKRYWAARRARLKPSKPS